MSLNTSFLGTNIILILLASLKMMIFLFPFGGIWTNRSLGPGADSSMDAANLLKPSLARGELQDPSPDLRVDAFGRIWFKKTQGHGLKGVY